MTTRPHAALTFALVLLLGAQAVGQPARRPTPVETPTGRVAIVVNGTQVAGPQPVVVDGRLYVPLVAIMDALAVSVSRDATGVVVNLPSGPVRVGTSIERNGSTFVPLRFIADTLGAEAQYDEQGRHVEIVSSLVGRNQSMAQAGPGGRTTITGAVSAIDLNSSPPAITVVRAGNARTISVSAGTRTTIQDVTTRTTVGGDLTAIHVGDSVSVTLEKDGTSVEILDLYASRTGTVVAVGSGAIVLSNGRVLIPTRATTITLNGDTAQASDLADGDDVIVRSNPETDEVREIIASRAVSSGASPAPAASGAPSGAAISSFEIGAQRPLRAGESFAVRLVGTPGGRATYDIGTFLTGLPMREGPAGVYTGLYTAGGSINIASVPVFGRLNVGAANAPKVQAKTLLSIATLPPQITEIGPFPNETVNNARPSIYATFQNPSGVGINPNSATLSVNGADVTGYTTRTNSFIAYSPGSSVADGRVNVTVRVADLAGNVASRSWSFTIRSH